MADRVDSTSTADALPSSMGTPPKAPRSDETSKNLLRRLLELIRFSHTVFALPFAGLACVFALTLPNELTPTAIALRLVGVLLCMVLARSAAMAFNRFVDAEIDARNPRTADRHIPSGQLTKPQVLAFLVLTSLGFMVACLLFLPNVLPVVFAIPVLGWICGYSYAKRFTAAAHLWLGVALALSPVCAWVAIRGEVLGAEPMDILPALILGIAIALWVAGFDIIYACQDAEFDRSHGLRSVPAKFGIAGAMRIAAGLHLGMLVVLALIPSFSPQLSLGWLYYLALSGVAVLIVRQHAIVSPSDLRRVGIAFFNINAIISLGFCSISAIDALLG